MKYRILRIIALLVILVNLSSCFEGRWAKYNKRYHYVHKKKYRRAHAHRNREW